MRSKIIKHKNKKSKKTSHCPLNFYLQYYTSDNSRPWFAILRSMLLLIEQNWI